MNQHLKQILLINDPLMVAATKMVLGVKHLANKEYGRDNLNTSSWFLASLLDNQVAKAEAKSLLEKMFKEDLVEGVDDVL